MPEWDKYHDTGVPSKSRRELVTTLSATIVMLRVVFEEWFEIEGKVFASSVRVFTSKNVLPSASAVNTLKSMFQRQELLISNARNARWP